jgi:pimeloyl-ACP methyl ester carboxylesterase
MTRALLDGVTLHYRRWPSTGPDVVLVHGLATDLGFWPPALTGRLAERFRLTAYDLRGHGGSEMPASGYGTAEMAGDLHRLLDRLEIARAHLVGHSYGGAVALQYTARHPGRVASLTVADTRVRALEAAGPGAGDPGAWTARRLASLGVTPLLGGPVDHRALEALAEARLRDDRGPGMLAFGASGWSAEAAERWLRLLRTTTARADLDRETGPSRQRLRRIATPVLAVYGEHSSCLASCHALRRALPGCQVRIVERAGHFHPLVRPGRFADTVAAFILEVTGGEAGHGR